MGDDSGSRPGPTRTGVTPPDAYAPPQLAHGDGEPASPRPHRLLDRLKSLFRARNGESVRETIEALIEDREQPEAPIDADERMLLKNILRMRDTTVHDVMVPRAHIVAVEIGTSFEALVRMMTEEAHSRLPVYRETLDDVLGMVHIKDVFAAEHAAADKGAPVKLEKLLRKLLFVPPSMGTLDLLLQMRMTRTHLALVVDEYGGTDGLVTIEDLVEQIVGEIEDEHDDDAAPAFERRPDGTILADAGTPIEELERAVGPILTDEEQDEVDTLAGLVTTLAGRVPGAGEVIHHPSGVEFEVLAGDARRVARLRLRNLPPAPPAHG
jgi:CBS domain containing-hemolysin-like protein